MRDETNFQNIEIELETRYGAAFMQGIVDSLARARVREQDAIETKEIKAALDRARARTRDLIRQYRSARMEYRLTLHSGGARADRVYRGYEEEFLHRQLQASIRLYLMANRDYHAARRHHLERLFRIGSPSTRAAAG